MINGLYRTEVIHRRHGARSRRSRSPSLLSEIAGLAVAGAAREHPVVPIFGLMLSIGLMGAAASLIAGLLQRYRWIAYVGLAIIVYVALEMIYRGTYEVMPVATSLMGT